MSYLSKLPQDIQELIVRLPFRVGLFISESDQTGGDESVGAERQALENIVTFYVEDTVKSEFAHEVMLATLHNRPKWNGWGENLNDVPKECLHLSYTLKNLIDTKEVMAFKQNLIEVGIAVAQAYCEFDETSSVMTKLEVYASLFFRKLQLRFSGQDAPSNDYLLNISGAERLAIELLSSNLDVKVTF